jgi:hypothetical protein
MGLGKKIASSRILTDSFPAALSSGLGASPLEEVEVAKRFDPIDVRGAIRIRF